MVFDKHITFVVMFRVQTSCEAWFTASLKSLSPSVEIEGRGCIHTKNLVKNFTWVLNSNPYIEEINVRVSVQIFNSNNFHLTQIGFQQDLHIGISARCSYLNLNYDLKALSFHSPSTFVTSDMKTTRPMFRPSVALETEFGSKIGWVFNIEAYIFVRFGLALGTCHLGILVTGYV